MFEVKNPENRSNTYRATVEMEDGKPVNDGGYVKQLKELISAMNKHTENRSWRVKLRGRGPRKKIAMQEKGIPESYASRYFRQDLPLKYAETADVYVYETTNWWSN